MSTGPDDPSIKCGSPLLLAPRSVTGGSTELRSPANSIAAGGNAGANGRRDHGRLILVDFARFLAILFMIQGHTLDVLLAPSYRQGAVFNSWLFLRGLTAPMFFTLSGISFTVASLRRWDPYSHFSPALLRRVGRFAFFILLGYTMHWPAKSLHDFRYLDLAGWEGWFQVDVLQCVGLTLLLLQTGILLARTPARFAKLAGAASICVVLTTPIAWTFGKITHLPLSLASYFNGQTGSLFPLFPWSGYIFFGAATGYLYVRWHERAQPKAIWPLAAGGLTLLLLGLTFNAIPLSFYKNLEFWKTSPNLFLIRVGSVYVLLAFLTVILKTIRIPHHVTRSLASESLTIYFVHSCCLYGSIWNRGLRQAIGPNLSPGPTLLWISALLLSMMALAWSWNWFKKNEPKGTALVRTALVVAAAYSLM